jgi:hypothetical protein
MVSIGRSFEKLETLASAFTMEVFAKILKPEWISDAAAAASTPTKRDRKLPAPFVVWLVIAMSVYRTLSIKNVLKRLGRVAGMPPLWADGEVPTSSSVSEARDRLGFGGVCALMARLQQGLIETYRDAMSWKGWLVLALDGTTFKMPDTTENRRWFGLPGISRGGRAAFPQMRAVFLVSTQLRFILRACFAPYRQGELTLAWNMINSLPERSLLVLDRFYLAWRFLLTVESQGHQFLLRVRKKARSTRIKRYAKGDHLVTVRLPRHLRRAHPELPRIVILRELTAQIRGRWYRYFTTLLNHKLYPARELIALYARRWEVETSIDEVKTHQCAATTVNRPVIFRSKRYRRVLQEAYALVIAYNVIRVIMTQAAATVSITPLRLSFVDSVEHIRQAALLMAISPTYALPAIYRDLLACVAQCLLPVRNRRNPREVCIKMSPYRKKWKDAM